MQSLNFSPFYKFPDPDNADENGLLAIGGNLSPEMLLSAYMQGIFPWFESHQPILWWSPDPRMILFPSRFKISHSLRQLLKQNRFHVCFNKNFREVISQCARVKRKGQSGTWITDEIISAYFELYKLGFAHSVESYLDDKLVGGLYGVSIGKAFFGESMFFIEPNASKIALFKLVETLKQLDFNFIDAQQSTSHLESLGAMNMPRKEFMVLLKNAVSNPFMLADHLPFD